MHLPFNSDRKWSKSIRSSLRIREQPQMSSLIGPKLQCLSPSFLLIPFRVLGPTLSSPGDFGHYFLKKISVDHRALTIFCRRFFRSLRHARLIAIGLDIITVYIHPIVKIILDHGSQTSTYCFFFQKNPLLVKNVTFSLLLWMHRN